MSSTRMPRWPLLFVLAAGLLLVAVLTLLLAAGLVGALALRRGPVRVPAIDVHLGRLHVMSFTSNNPNCHPLLLPNCGAVTAHPSAGRQRYYMLWAVSVRETRLPGGAAIWEQVGGGQILQWPLGP